MTAYLGNPHDSPVWEQISDEIARAERKFGLQLHLNDLEWFAVLAEEVGEVAMDVTKREVRPVNLTADSPTSRDLRAEIVQVAAVAVRWLDALDQRQSGSTR